jgi:hypothetical protein
MYTCFICRRVRTPCQILFFKEESQQKCLEKVSMNMPMSKMHDSGILSYNKSLPENENLSMEKVSF